MSTYVLDTSALLAYIENEEGSEEIKNVLIEALLLPGYLNDPIIMN